MIVPALKSAVCGEFQKPLILGFKEFSKKVKDGTMENPQETKAEM